MIISCAFSEISATFTVITACDLKQSFSFDMIVTVKLQAFQFLCKHNLAFFEAWDLGRFQTAEVIYKLTQVRKFIT